jgi:transposase
MDVIKLVKKYGSIAAAAKATGIPRQTLSGRYNREVKKGNAPSRANTPLEELYVKQAALLRKDGKSKPEMAAIMGLNINQVRRVIDRAKKEGLIDNENAIGKSREEAKRVVKAGRVKAVSAKRANSTKGVRRYLFTGIQNDTRLHEGFWTNLLAFAKFYNAEIHVSRYTYVKQGLGAKGDKKQLKPSVETKGEMVWDERASPYFSDERMRVAKGLVWCGEMNILPTATRPLSGLEVYTGRDSGIFPHAKIAMEAVPSNKNEPTKFNYTTGTATLRNYIHRKAGLKAEFHHAYGALFVEVDENDDWYVRQINAEDNGTFYEDDVKVENGVVTTGHNWLAAHWGDGHYAIRDKGVYELVWGKGGIVDQRKPKYQFIHDILDSRSRSHHEIKDPHIMFKRYVHCEEDVRKEVANVVQFLTEESYRPWMETIVVDSNHHSHLGRWLKEQNGLRDPINAMFWAEMHHRSLRRIAQLQSVNYLKEAFLLINGDSIPGNIYFLDQDESFVLKDVEFGNHGDKGPGGSRGSPRAFAKMGRRMSIGHHHGHAGIVDGVTTAGTFSMIMPDWTSGPDSWSHSFVTLYPNGKRAICTIWKGKYRVPR